MTKFDPREDAPNEAFRLSFPMGRELRIAMRLDKTCVVSLGRPAVCPMAELVAVGTDDPDSKTHALAIVELDKLRRSPYGLIASSPIVGTSMLKECVRDTCWLGRDRVLIAAGNEGLVQLYAIDRNNVSALRSLNGEGTAVHDDGIRELIVGPAADQVASCGFDNSLRQWDPARLAGGTAIDGSSEPGPRPSACAVRCYDLKRSVSSLRWNPRAASELSATTDDGWYQAFDLRVANNAPSYAFDSGQEDMFAHELFGEHLVMLGYASGDLRFYDRRHSKRPVASTSDPYCDCVGNIHRRQSRNGQTSFIVTGMSDVSLWTLNASGAATVVGHAFSTPHRRKSTSHSKLSNVGENANGFICTASYTADDEIVMATGYGTLDLSSWNLAAL